MRISLLTLFLLITGSAILHGQSIWFVDAQAGSNSNNGQSVATAFSTVSHAIDPNNGFVQPGDTIYLKGEFTNSSYDDSYTFSGNISDPHIWHGENSIRINDLNGSPGAYITFFAYDSTTVLKGDGANILRVSNSSYLTLQGFEVYGEVEEIPYSTALALQFLWDSSGTVVYRVPPGTADTTIANMTFPVLGSVPRPSYTDTRGVYLSNVHHINLYNNHVHHTPGGGIRVSECDYINIEGNEVNDCSRKSFSGTHALVVTKATSVDTSTAHKINIVRNRVHHNFNEIYSWAPTKSIITPHIDEGKGISLQRNDTLNGDWRHGRFWVANNLCYWNGYSGVHSNGGMRMDFVNNTCYFNSYTKTITYAGSTSGGNIGISTSDGDDIRIVNNISVIDGNLGGNAIASANTINLVVSDNLIYGNPGPINQDPDVVAVQVNMAMADPLFVNPTNFDFHLQVSSPAIGTGNVAFTPSNDFFGNLRDSVSDLGAVDHVNPVGLESPVLESSGLVAFPNPCQNEVRIRSGIENEKLEIYDLAGRNVTSAVLLNNLSAFETRIDMSSLSKGLYLVRSLENTVKLVKE